MDATELAQTEESTDLIVEVKTFTVIATADQYSRVATLRGLIKDLTGKYTEDKQPAIDSAKAHLDLLKKELSDKVDPLNTEYKRLGGLLSTYNAEQERIKKRKELEIGVANKAAAEKEKQELAALAKQLGDKDLAKQIKETPVEGPPVFVAKDVPQVDGLSYSETWHYEVTSLTELVKAVAADKISIHALANPNKPFRSGYLHKQATSLGSLLNYPGVRTWSTKEPRQS